MSYSYSDVQSSLHELSRRQPTKPTGAAPSVSPPPMRPVARTPQSVQVQQQAPNSYLQYAMATPGLWNLAQKTYGLTTPAAQAGAGGATTMGQAFKDVGVTPTSSTGGPTAIGEGAEGTGVDWGSGASKALGAYMTYQELQKMQQAQYGGEKAYRGGMAALSAYGAWNPVLLAGVGIANLVEHGMQNWFFSGDTDWGAMQKSRAHYTLKEARTPLNQWKPDTNPGYLKSPLVEDVGGVPQVKFATMPSTPHQWATFAPEFRSYKGMFTKQGVGGEWNRNVYYGQYPDRQFIGDYFHQIETGANKGLNQFYKGMTDFANSLPAEMVDEKQQILDLRSGFNIPGFEVFGSDTSTPYRGVGYWKDLGTKGKEYGQLFNKALTGQYDKAAQVFGYENLTTMQTEVAKQQQQQQQEQTDWEAYEQSPEYGQDIKDFESLQRMSGLIGGRMASHGARTPSWEPKDYRVGGLDAGPTVLARRQ